ncbi:unnamed protein product, partial [Heterotrigona itama]
YHLAVGLGSEGSRSPGIVIGSPLSPNRFQSVDFAGSGPHPAGPKKLGKVSTVAVGPLGVCRGADDRTDSCEFGHLFQFSRDFCMAQVMRARDHPFYALSSILGSSPFDRSYPQKPFRKLSAVSYEDLDSREKKGPHSLGGGDAGSNRC